ncbi:MAG: hypothetical protein JNM31_11265 [Flavobacteriales bacterium]|nr:hypothetical protein [Flavobacteriales bacterium]
MNSAKDINLLEYKGQISSELRIHLLDLLQCAALINLGRRSDLKKLVGIALELLDNAQRHNAANEVDFRWEIRDDELVVTITNKASSTDAHRLAEAVESIHRMNPEEITEAFKRQMTTEGFGENGGAGLGILQIARKVGNQISAHIEPLQDDEYLCTSKVSTSLRR